MHSLKFDNTININIMEMFPSHFDEVYRDIHFYHKYSNIYLPGGRGSCKSSYVPIEIITGLFIDKNSNALVLRKIDKDVKSSVFYQILWALDILHLSSYFTVNMTTHTITRIKTGQQIICKGCSDPLSLKSIRPRHGYFKFVWLEEADQFTPEEIRSVLQSAMRGFGLQKGLKFYTYNPNKSIDNWLNKHVMEVEARIKQGLDNNSYVCHSTYLGVNKEWLGEEFLLQAEELKNTNPKAYANEYLGEITGTGGQIFENVKSCEFVEQITEEMQADTTKCFYTMKDLEYMYFGLDFGFAIDPTAFIVVSFNKTKRSLYIIDEFYKVGATTALIAEEIKKLNKNNLTITCDSAEPRTIHDLREYGINLAPAIKGADSVHHGVRYLQSLTNIYIDKLKCPNTYREFIGYSYKQNKDGSFRSDYPDKDNHSVDAVRYALEQRIRNSNTGFYNIKRVGW